METELRESAIESEFDKDAVCRDVFRTMIEQLDGRNADRLLAGVLKRISKKENADENVTGMIGHEERLKCLLYEIGLQLRMRHARLRMVAILLFKVSGGAVQRVAFHLGEREVDLACLAARIESAQRAFEQMTWRIGARELGLPRAALLPFWREMTMLSESASKWEDRLLAEESDLTVTMDSLMELLNPADPQEASFYNALDSTLDTLWDLGSKGLEVTGMTPLQAKSVDETGKMTFHLETPETKRAKVFCQYFEFAA